MNTSTTGDRSRTAQKRRRRGLAVLAVVLSTAVISTVETTSALDPEVSADLSARGRHVRSTPRHDVEATAAGGRMILR
jgi:hypothetical protein